MRRREAGDVRRRSVGTCSLVFFGVSLVCKDLYRTLPGICQQENCGLRTYHLYCAIACLVYLFSNCMVVVVEFPETFMHTAVSPYLNAEGELTLETAETGKHTVGLPFISLAVQSQNPLGRRTPI